MCNKHIRLADTDSPLEIGGLKCALCCLGTLKGDGAGRNGEQNEDRRCVFEVWCCEIADVDVHQLQVGYVTDLLAFADVGVLRVISSWPRCRLHAV